MPCQLTNQNITINTQDTTAISLTSDRRNSTERSYPQLNLARDLSCLAVHERLCWVAEVKKINLRSIVVGF
ncbi:MAG: hypothetical protein V7K27_15950 [Nostoc sp.]|uniref:hypothetical protein n=1 Tax=Nostoc sp. TaxID=1180 RepID=UPI002FF6B7F7